MTITPTMAPTLVFSPDQEAAIASIQAWAVSDRKNFRLGGLAGCGKTTIAAMLPSLLGTGSIQFCAPTGRAASVLTRKMGTEARTLHSLLYIAESFTTHGEDCVCSEKHAQHPETFKCVTEEGNPVGGCERIGCICPSSIIWHKRSDMLCECYGDEKCALHRNPLADILVVDEASMVGKTLYEDVSELPCRVIWVGDYGQLPPVMDGKGVLSEANLDAKLTQIHRQADNPEGTNIVELAHAVRAYGKNAALDWTGPGVTIKRMPVASAKLNADPSRLVICWKNKTRVMQNKQMRAMMGYPEGTPVVGDKIICLRNNREAKIFNGRLGVIAAIEDDRPYTYKVTLNMEDGNVFVGDVVKAQFSVEKTLNDGYGNLFDYGYAVTAHKAQGSEADEVVVLMEGANFNGEFVGASDPKWAYTAITRAKSKLTLVMP